VKKSPKMQAAIEGKTIPDQLKSAGMNYDEKLNQIADYVKLFFIQHDDPRLYYHNIDHTRDMAEKANLIATHYNLDAHDRFIVSASAWFHDVGYLVIEPPFHEMKGAEIADDFLRHAGVREDLILAIRQCILSTKMPQSPVTELEKIICDADLFHLGKNDFWERSKILRKETEALIGRKISGSEWRQKTIELMEKHEYHTDYCRELLGPTKMLNLEFLKKRQVEKLTEKAEEQARAEAEAQAPAEQPAVAIAAEIPENAVPLALPDPSGPKDKEKKEKKKKTKRPDRGVETMFRITAANQQRLSNQADNKAHIMISVNSIIISVALGLIVRKLDENRNLAIPTMILLLVNTITIIYSVLATRPKVPTSGLSGMITREQIENKGGNLLFFGDFFKMEWEDYKWGMGKMMGDREYLYGTMVRDVYLHGKVLARKFRLLQISYTIFMYGIAMSIIAYIISAIYVNIP